MLFYEILYKMPFYETENDYVFSSDVAIMIFAKDVIEITKE